MNFKEMKIEIKELQERWIALEGEKETLSYYKKRIFGKYKTKIDIETASKETLKELEESIKQYIFILNCTYIDQEDYYE